MSTVLVTGATGNLGRLLLPRLIDDGHRVRTFSRTDGTPEHAELTAFRGDLADGSGLVEAIDGVDTVVHCASDPRRPAADVAGIGQLISAMRSTTKGPHLIYVSIVGVDAIPTGYYRAKRQVEQAVERSELPWTIQRATQFHSFVETMLKQLARSPVMVAPRGFSFQPVATTEVAARLADHVNHVSVGRAADIGGPEILAARDLARTWLQVRQRRRAVVSPPVPGNVGSAFRSGANLCPDGIRGHITWGQHLSGEGSSWSGPPSTTDLPR